MYDMWGNMSEGKRITFYLNADLSKRLTEECMLRQIAVSRYIADLIERDLAGRELAIDAKVKVAIDAYMSYSPMPREYAELRANNRIPLSFLQFMKITPAEARESIWLDELSGYNEIMFAVTPPDS